MTRPVILVEICYNLLYVIQGVKNILDEVTSWPQLISKLLVIPACLQYLVLLLIGLTLFYTQGVFVQHVHRYMYVCISNVRVICNSFLIAYHDYCTH